MSSKYAQFRAALTIAVVAAVVVFILWAGDLFVRLRLQLNDVYFLPTPVSDQIVLVAIDDASLEQFGRTPVEWSRTVFADFVRILAAARARIVTFDILFAQATPDDVEFAAAMQAARQTQSRTRFVMPIVGVERAPDEAHAISYQETLRPTPGLAAVLDYLGYVNVFTDADNRVRRQPSLVTAGSGRGYSLSITTFLAYLRVPAAAFEQVVTVENGTLTIAGGHQLAIDANGIWRQDFFAPSQSVEGFTTVSFRDVVNGGVDPAVFDDKIVMVGLMNSVNAPDERATPLQPSMAGVEIHAHAVETLLQGITLTEQSRLSEAVTILATALVSSLIYTRLRWRGMTITALILGVVMVLCAFTLFAVRREVINLFHPLLTLIVALLLSIGWQITTETNRRRSAEHLLAVIQRQKDLLEAIVRGSPAGIVVVDRAGILTHANQAFTEAVGLEKKTLIDQPLASVIDAIGLTD
ncbi:MAG: CHASE2 domain-containing protein, partial [Anaerolinea sp.]|nr:CHASE2 domain-containing protein [Anaerolinea sp.]